jgi:hypothetical protein
VYVREQVYVPYKYWVEAVHTSVYLLNWSPTKGTQEDSRRSMVWMKTSSKSSQSFWFSGICMGS